GPALPRRDREELYSRYCRLMLIFFKPWYNARQLRQHGETWIHAFQSFLKTCSVHIQKIMDNMQIPHECK
ncbi:hypothetical protein BKA93DRAFT_710500, partial [Sparassis latifolia]